jgi:hypothetical protein
LRDREILGNVHLMVRFGKNQGDSAVVSSVSFRDRNGSVFQTLRRPDGSKVVALSRDVHERALARAKLALARD